MHAITWLWANEDLTQGSWHCNHIRGGKNQSTVVSINQYHNTSEIRFRAEIANYSNSQEEWIINSASDNTQNETLEYARVRMTLKYVRVRMTLEYARVRMTLGYARVRMTPEYQNKTTKTKSQSSWKPRKYINSDDTGKQSKSANGRVLNLIFSYYKTFSRQPENWIRVTINELIGAS